MISQSPIRIIIADDHQIYRDGLIKTLSEIAHFQVIDSCINGEQLINAVRIHQPDIVLTDLKMPVKTGVEAIAAITDHYPAVRCLALSNFDSEYQIIKAMNAGAMGYIQKTSDNAEIFDAIEQVYKGDEYYCKSTSKKLMRLALKNLTFIPKTKKSRHCSANRKKRSSAGSVKITTTRRSLILYT
jgi:DNA-binding NarL/FixJ family response regulator